MRIGFEGGTQRGKKVKKAGDIGLTQRGQGSRDFGMRWDGVFLLVIFRLITLRLGVLSDSGREDRF